MISLLVFAALQSVAQPQTFTLETTEPVWDIALEDLDMDGGADLLALCCDPKASPLNKSLAVFLSTEAGGYPPAPSFVLPLDAGTGTFFLAETDGAAPRELILANAEGATVYVFRDGALTASDTAAFRSLLPSGVKQPRFLKGAAQDLDGDGIDEWLIPANGGYLVRSAAEPRCLVTCDVESDIRDSGTIQIKHQVPALHVLTLEDQPLKGLAFLSKEYADFAYGENWTERQRYKVPLNSEEKWDASVQMQDIDGNGLPDLIVNQSKGTVNVTAMTHVYIASAPFTYPETPSAVFNADRSIAAPYLIDVDGDEKLDVLFIKVPFGVKTIVNLFLRKKVAVEVDVFLFDGAGFSAKPDFATTVTIDAPEQREVPVYTMADFSGDGRVDVMFGSGNTEIVIHSGETSRFISNKPWVTLPFVPFGDARPCDLNANKAKDLVLFHPGGKDDTKIEVAVF